MGNGHGPYPGGVSPKLQGGPAACAEQALQGTRRSPPLVLDLPRASDSSGAFLKNNIPRNSDVIGLQWSSGVPFSEAPEFFPLSKLTPGIPSPCA